MPLTEETLLLFFKRLVYKAVTRTSRIGRNRYSSVNMTRLQCTFYRQHELSCSRPDRCHLHFSSNCPSTRKITGFIHKTEGEALRSRGFSPSRRTRLLLCCSFWLHYFWCCPKIRFDFIFRFFSTTVRPNQLGDIFSFWAKRRNLKNSMT